MNRLRHACVVGFAFLVACGESTTGPQVQTTTFPDVDQAVLATYCIRGTANVPAIRGGNVTTGDCPTESTLVGGTDEGYWEGWRVRVATAVDVTFSVDSDYDTFLDVFQIDLANPRLTNLVVFDDDSGENGNAELTVTLSPDTEYWVLVSGFQAEDVGSYTLSVN